jgi:amidohydrolase family protein
MAAPVYDLHQHLWPEPLLGLLRRRTAPPYLRADIVTTLEGAFPVDLSVNDLDGRIQALDRAGIDVAVVCLQPTLGIERLPAAERGELFEAYNAGIQELVAASSGRLRALASGGYVSVLDGLCVGASQLLDPAALAEALEPLERSGGFLFVHPDRVERLPGGAPPWWTAVAAYTADMQAAYLAWIVHSAETWLRLPVVFSLLAGGAPFQLERLRSRGVATRRFTDAPVYLETSSYGRAAVELSIAAFGLDRIVHGSDYPVIDPGRTLQALAAFGPMAFNALTSHNPRILLRDARDAHDDEGAGLGSVSEHSTVRPHDVSDDLLD